jgi:hypothetical protein
LHVEREAVVGGAVEVADDLLGDVDVDPSPSIAPLRT